MPGHSAQIFIFGQILFWMFLRKSLPEINIKTWTWGISSRLLQQSTAATPYLGGGYLLTVAPPDLLWGCSSDLGHGVVPPGRHLWPQGQGLFGFLLLLLLSHFSRVRLCVTP